MTVKSRLPVVLLLFVLLAHLPGAVTPRADAQAQVGARERPDIHTLMQALQDEDVQARRSAAETFASAHGKWDEAEFRPAIPLLTRALQEEDVQVRIHAAEALGYVALRVKDVALFDVAFQTLKVTLKDHHPDVRGLGVEAFGHMVSRVGGGAALGTATDLVTKALHDEDTGVRIHAAVALGYIASRRTDEAMMRTALQTLQGVLQDENADVRRRATEAVVLMLRRIRGQAAREMAIQLFLEALQDEDAGVRTSAATGLRNLAIALFVIQSVTDAPEVWKDAIPLLMVAMEDEDAALRGAAASTLGFAAKRVQDEAMMESVLRTLREALQDDDEGVRRNTASALKMLVPSDGEDAAAPAAIDDESAMRSSIQTSLEALADEDVTVRRSAAKALASAGWRDRGKAMLRNATPLLTQALQDEDAGVRRSAAMALWHVADSVPIQVWLKALKDEDAGVRGQAMGGFVRVVPGVRDPVTLQAVIAVLTDALRDKDAQIRRGAAVTLGGMTYWVRDQELVRRVILALIEALDEDDARLRGTVAFHLGRMASRVGDQPTVEAVIQALTGALDSEDASVRRSVAAPLGNLYAALGRHNEAIEVYKQALELESANPWIGVDRKALDLKEKLARAYEAAGKLQEAEAIDAGATDPTILSQRMARYLQQGDLEKLLETVQRILALQAQPATRAVEFPGEAVGYPVLGSPHYAISQLIQGYSRQDKLDELAGIFEKRLTDKPQDPTSYIALGQVYVRQRDWDKACTMYEKAAELAPDDVMLQRDLGQLYQAQQMYPKAIAALRKALDLQPGWIQLYTLLADAYARTDQVDEALKLVDELTQHRQRPISWMLGGNRASTKAAVGDIYLAAGHYDDAIDAYKQAIELKPSRFWEKKLARVYQKAAEAEGWALQFDGRDDYVVVPHVPFDDYVGFTVEVWVKGWEDAILCQGKSGDPENRIWMWLGAGGAKPPATCGWESDKGTNYQHAIGGSRTLEWDHVALVFDGKQQLIFFNGSVVHAGPAPPPGPLDGSRRFLIGAHQRGALKFGSGSLRSLRISKIARYQTEFVPPARFVSDNDTVVLFDLSGSQSRRLRDASGHQRHGTIKGPRWTRLEPPSDRKSRPPTIDLPTTSVGGYLMVQAHLEDQGPFNFLVDTGAMLNVVSTSVAKRFGEKIVPGSGTVIGAGGGRRQITELLQAVHVRVGEVEFPTVTLAVLDLDELSDAMGFEIDGVFGPLLFKDYLLTFDFPQQQISLGRGLLPERPGPEILPLRVAGRDKAILGMFIPLRMDSKILWAVLDTGSNGSISLPADDLQFLHGPFRASSYTVTIAGTSRDMVGRLDAQLGLAGHIVQDPIVTIVDGPPTLGLEVLRHFVVTLDLRSKRVRLLRNQTDPITLGPVRNIGAGFLKRSVPWTVAYVIPDGPAAQQGLQVGDSVVAINHQPVSRLGSDSWRRMLDEQDEIVLRVSRDTGEIELVVPVVVLVP